MTNINNIRKEISNVISTSVNTVQDVADYQKTGFTGYPAVSISMSDNENDFWSTAENMRKFVFDLNIFVQISKDVGTADDNAQQRAERVMGNVVSDILDAFDDEITLNGEADFVDASPSAWDFVQLPGGFMRYAKIKVQVNKIYTLS